MNDYVYLITNDEGAVIGAFYEVRTAVVALESLPYPGRIKRVPYYLTAEEMRDDLHLQR